MIEMDDKQVRKDRLRYTRDSLSSTLTYLAILFNVFFFVCIYKKDVGTYYYNILIGISVVYNLIFMMAAFLCSEGVKNYKKGYGWVLILLGIGQIVRIFILPWRAFHATVTLAGVEMRVMETPQFTKLVIYALLSAACAIIAGAVSLIKTKILNDYEKSLEK